MLQGCVNFWITKVGIDYGVAKMQQLEWKKMQWKQRMEAKEEPAENVRGSDPVDKGNGDGDATEEGEGKVESGNDESQGE